MRTGVAALRRLRTMMARPLSISRHKTADGRVGTVPPPRLPNDGSGAHVLPQRS